ncbi:MAG: histidinol-phosphatase HisJ family protein [Clostridia bacterium]|nr:histidinol-phosphatase HisJ family protein [Clostridia bacterium]
MTEREIRLPDSHMHSRFSFDGKHSIKELCAEGLRKNLLAVAITDHCELTVSGDMTHWSHRDMCLSRMGARRQKRRMGGKMTVCVGLELGQPMHNIPQQKDILRRGNYDFVLASVHYLRDGRDFYYLNYTDGTSDAHEVYDKYLTELLETARDADFDSLAHMTYPLRYIIGRDKVDFDETPYLARYDEILSLLVQRGKALEINVSGYRRENGFPLPTPDIVRRYKELGGKYITLGSDTHRIGDLAVGIEEGAQIARDAGFDRVVYYVGRQPVDVML